jgi:hypothetical protein
MMDWVELDDVKLRYIKISQVDPNYRYVDESLKTKCIQNLNICQYLEFVIISDTKMISSRFTHLLSGLKSIFNHFLTQKWYKHLNRALFIALCGLHFQIHKKNEP